MKNSTQRTSCVHNSKKSDALSGIMQLSMAILFAFSITTQAEAIEYPSAKVQTAINQQSKIKITGTVVDQAIATAIAFQNWLANIGINPSTVVKAASIIGRKRTIADSVIALAGSIPASRCC